MDLWYWKRPLYQLSNNHCHLVGFFLVCPAHYQLPPPCFQKILLSPCPLFSFFTISNLKRNCMVKSHSEISRVNEPLNLTVPLKKTSTVFWQLLLSCKPFLVFWSQWQFNKSNKIRIKFFPVNCYNYDFLSWHNFLVRHNFQHTRARANDTIYKITDIDTDTEDSRYIHSF